MKISKLLNCIQENLNSGCLTLDSEVYIRNNWGDIHPVEDVRIEENELLLADLKLNFNREKEENRWIGTFTLNGQIVTKGRCISGDPYYFYKSKIVAWKKYDGGNA